MASQQTQATRQIIANIERSLKASCVSYPDIMMGCILDEATDLTNEHGYRWDVALSKACSIYPATKYAGRVDWSEIN
jgi:hypothetical protein